MSRRTRKYLVEYATRTPERERGASELEAYLRRVLSPSPIPIHLITARAKSVEGLRGKLRRKRYRDPEAQVTDHIAARVIVYYVEDVDRVTDELRAILDVNKTKSRDARAQMGEHEFGYRSNHLVARVRRAVREGVEGANLKALGGRWCEIQIRTILDHAWSEIEHELVYKSGVAYPKEVRRRFFATAGALEVLEHTFHRLAAERDRLIEDYVAQFRSGKEPRERLDAAQLMAFLEVTRADGRSWRSAERERAPFSSSLIAACLDGLDLCGLRDSSALRRAMSTTAFRRRIEAYAAASGISARDVAHPACVALAIVGMDVEILHEVMPDIATGNAIQAALRG